MRAVEDLIYRVSGQSISFDPPEGRPSSVTSVDVYFWNQTDDVTTETALAISASATVETDPNTTVDAASGFGQTDPRLLNVAATTGFEVGRRYLVTAASGIREWIEVAEIDDGNSVTAKHPLHNAYASGDTVASTRISVDILDSWTSNLDRVLDVGPDPMYRARWIYIVDGDTYVADSYFNLVRYGGRSGVLPEDVEAIAPGWLDRLPTDHRADQGQRLIATAYREIKFDLYGIDIDDANIADSELMDELVRWKTVAATELAQLMAGGGDPTRYELAAKQYQQRLDSLVRIKTSAPIRDHSGAAHKQPARQLTRR